MTAAHPGYSGFRLVSDGTFAFALRAALVRNAQRSLDLQYYIWHSDVTGRLLAREVIAAADRGVRVRLLLDDLDARGRDFWLAAADAHPNIEVRLFNPFAARRGPLRKIGEVLTAYSRINHRMHNKNLIADNRVAISGGRNIGDEYFSAEQGVELHRPRLRHGRPGRRRPEPHVRPLLEFRGRLADRRAAPDRAKPEDLVALRDGLERHAQEPDAQRWLATLPGNAAVAAFVAGQMPLHWTERWQVVCRRPAQGTTGRCAAHAFGRAARPVAGDARVERACRPDLAVLRAGRPRRQSLVGPRRQRAKCHRAHQLACGQRCRRGLCRLRPLPHATAAGRRARVRTQARSRDTPATSAWPDPRAPACIRRPCSSTTTRRSSAPSTSIRARSRSTANRACW